MIVGFAGSDRLCSESMADECDSVVGESAWLLLLVTAGDGDCGGR